MPLHSVPPTEADTAEIRSARSDPVPGALRSSVSELSRRKMWIYWTDFLASLSTGYLAFVLFPLARPFSLPAVLAFAVAVCALYRAVIFTHEIAHMPAHGFRRVPVYVESHLRDTTAGALVLIRDALSTPCSPNVRVGGGWGIPIVRTSTAPDSRVLCPRVVFGGSYAGGPVSGFGASSLALSPTQSVCFDAGFCAGNRWRICTAAEARPDTLAMGIAGSSLFRVVRVDWRAGIRWACPRWQTGGGVCGHHGGGA